MDRNLFSPTQSGQPNLMTSWNAPFLAYPAGCPKMACEHFPLPLLQH